MEDPIWLLATLALLASATRVEATTVPCPVGTGDVRIHRLVVAAPVGGWDSDGATYARGGQFRALEVSTCPSGLSMYGDDLALGLPPSQREEIQPVLAAIRARTDSSAATAPAWRRHLDAAAIYTALGRDPEAAQLTLSAAWLVRDQAVGVFEGLQGPVAADRMLAAGPTELAKALAPAVRKQVTFNLAVVAHRAGDPAARERYLAAMAALPLSPAEASRVQAFTETVTLEARLLEQARTRWTTLSQDTSTPQHLFAAYLAADLNRRLGQEAQARPLYARVARAEAAPAELRALASYFVSKLAGGTPWVDADEALARVPTFAR